MTPEEFEDLLRRQEDLHEDLKPWLVEARGAGTMLNAPLMQQLFYHAQLNAMINRSYEAKKKALDQAIVKGDFGQALAIHERPYRWRVFAEMASLCKPKPKTYWESVAWLLIDTENQWQSLREIRSALHEGPGDRDRWLMTDEERGELSEMPDLITVFRGCREHNRDGLSWTTDPAKAKWFAERFASSKEGGDCLIRVGEIRRLHVIAYLTSRGEEEILAEPKNVYVIDEKIVAFGKPRS